MRTIFIFICIVAYFAGTAQNSLAITLKKDSLLIIGKKPKKGFCNDYLLFVPKGTPRYHKIVLLVEPNNTGKTSDSIDVHKQYAIGLASVSSVGNNVATELKIPLLVPIFPRPAALELTYTHALDRGVMLENSAELKRLDLQLLAMIKDAKSVLKSMNIEVDARFFMTGFSASASFTNRFSYLHPEKIKALAIGGFNGELLLPQNEINGIAIDYPIGTHDFAELFGNKPDLKTYKSIPQFIYMGQQDQNDAVQYDDAYDDKQRKIINENIGSEVQQRYVKCQEIYKQQGFEPIFKTYANIGHWTTAALNLDVIRFFKSQIQQR